MMGSDTAYLGMVLLVANVIVSYGGFQNPAFFNQLKFHVGSILGKKDYMRLVTSGFLHGSWMHLIFNMWSLYAFSEALELSVGQLNFFLIYFGSLIGGNLFSLYMHRHEEHYSAIGASGAVSGVIFAAIALFPDMDLQLILIPIPIPSWFFGIAFVLISIRGIKTQSDNIGHDAHLGGGLIGLILTVAMYPSVLQLNPLPIVLIAVPSIVFLFIIFQNPDFLITGKWGKKPKFFSKDELFNSRRAANQKEIDRILEKIADNGFDSLTDEEKDILDRNADK